MRLLLALDCQTCKAMYRLRPAAHAICSQQETAKVTGGRGSSVTRNVCCAATSEGIPRPTNDHSPAGLLWVIQDIPTLNDASENEFGNRMPLGLPIG